MWGNHVASKSRLVRRDRKKIHRHSHPPACRIGRRTPVANRGASSCDTVLTNRERHVSNRINKDHHRTLSTTKTSTKQREFEDELANLVWKRRNVSQPQCAAQHKIDLAANFSFQPSFFMLHHRRRHISVMQELVRESPASSRRSRGSVDLFYKDSCWPETTTIRVFRQILSGECSRHVRPLPPRSSPLGPTGRPDIVNTHEGYRIDQRSRLALRC